MVPAILLIKRLDKNMRNKFIVIHRKGDKEYANGKQFGLILDRILL